MSRFAAAGFLGIIAVAGLIAWRVSAPRQLVAEADNRELLEAIGTEIKAGNAALTPTETPYLTSTPTKTPRPPTATPHPTYGPDASPGLWIVPAWTETSIVPLTVEAVGLPLCVDVTPRPYADQPCRVEETP